MALYLVARNTFLWLVYFSTNWAQLPRLFPSFCCLLCLIFHTLYSKLQVACQALILNLTNKIVDYLSHLLHDRNY